MVIPNKDVCYCAEVEHMTVHRVFMGPWVGVPQGSVLGPLFSMCSSDRSMSLNCTRLGYVVKVSLDPG